MLLNYSHVWLSGIERIALVEGKAGQGVVSKVKISCNMCWYPLESPSKNDTWKKLPFKLEKNLKYAWIVFYFPKWFWVFVILPNALGQPLKCKIISIFWVIIGSCFPFNNYICYFHCLCSLFRGLSKGLEEILKGQEHSKILKKGSRFFLKFWLFDRKTF